MQLKTFTKRRLCIYDFETTGFKAEYRYPIQLAIKTVDLQDNETDYNYYFKCPVRIPDDIVELTEITDDFLKENGRPIEEIFAEVNELIRTPDTYLIGHNILRFDNNFMDFWLKKLGYPPLDHVWTFDTACQFKAHLMQKRLGQYESFNVYHHPFRYAGGSTIEWNLEELCKYYGIQTAAFHKADADVDYTHAIFKEQIKDYENVLPVNYQRLSDKNKVFALKKSQEGFRHVAPGSYRQRKPFGIYGRK